MAKLSERTKQGKLAWEETAVRDEFVSVFRGKFTVTIARDTDDLYRFKVVDDKDRAVVSVSAKQATADDIALIYLFEAAQASGKKLSDVDIDSILDDLRKAG